jgi:hypothetical protein
MLNRKAYEAENRLGMVGSKIPAAKAPLPSPTLHLFRPTDPASSVKTNHIRSNALPKQSGFQSVIKAVKTIVRQRSSGALRAGVAERRQTALRIHAQWFVNAWVVKWFLVCRRERAYTGVGRVPCDRGVIKASIAHLIPSKRVLLGCMYIGS